MSRLSGRALVSRASRRRFLIATVRALLTATVLLGLYYVMPLDSSESNVSVVVRLGIGIVAFVALLIWQLREIMHADYPGLRAFQGLALAVPLFLILFASTYFLMSEADATNFSAPLTRTDALYFTITVFATVGFGDITAKAEAARLMVSAQMLLDLAIIGAGVRVIMTAVERGRERQTSTAEPDPGG